MNLVDFHCHLDLYTNHAAAFADCERLGIHTFTMTTTPRAWPHNRELASKTRYVRAGLGIHPQLVAERAKEMSLFEEYLTQTRYVGEVGLDAGPRFYHSLELQQEVFGRILKLCARAGGKILSIHSVRTAATVLNMVEEFLPPGNCRVILHWFTGSKKEAQRAIDLGCYFSVNAEMMNNDRHRAMVAALPLERILTETDGPFCQRNGKPMQPQDSSRAVDLLAQSRAMDAKVLSEIIVSNVHRLEEAV